MVSVFRKISTWAVIATLVFGSLFSPTNSTVAQDDTGFTGDVVVEGLATGELPPTVTAPGILFLDQVLLPAKAGLPTRDVVTAEILYVEEGTLTIADGFGLGSTIAAEKSVSLRSGSSYTAINDSDSEVSFLRLNFVSAGSSATPAAASVPSETSGGATVVSLAEFMVNDLPTEASALSLFLDRTTWSAGIDSGPYVHNGPIAIFSKSGTLTISSPSGIDGQLSEGNAVLFPADLQLQTRNDGSDEAVAYLFGIIPVGTQAITAVSESDAVDSESDDSDATGSTASGNVLYQADSTTGFDGWSMSPSWVTVSNMLVNDGSSGGPAFASAPFESPAMDYAIEVELQWTREGNSFGAVVRGGEDSGYWVGNATIGCDQWKFGIWAGIVPQDTKRARGIYCDLEDETNLIFAGDEVGPDPEWHTYRIEVQGNTIRVFIDGTEIVETSDNRFLTPGEVGVWSHGGQVSVRKFTVIAL